MKKILLLFTVLPLIICSCDKNDDVIDEWPEWHQSNDNHLITGAWMLDSMEIIAYESDNQTAVDMIYDQYKSHIGVIIGFSDSGYYTDSGSYGELVSKYRLVDNQLYFSKD